MTLPSRYVLTLDEHGRLQLPASLRRRLALKLGTRLVATVEPDGSLRVVTARALARSFQAPSLPIDSDGTDEGHEEGLV